MTPSEFIDSAAADGAIGKALLKVKAGQRGAATLLASTVLLMSISVISVYTARMSIIEQRVAANAIWSQQTSDAAQSVMDNITNFSQADLQILAAGATSITFTNDSANVTSSAQKNNPAITVPVGIVYTALVSSADAFKTAEIAILATGVSGVSKQSLYEKVSFGSFLLELPLSTVTALGTATFPQFSNITASIATTNATAVVDGKRVCPSSQSIMANAVTPATPPAPTATEAGVAIFTSNPAAATLENLTPIQFDANFFSDSSKHLAESSRLVIDCKKGCTNVDVQGRKGLLWIEGDLSLQGGILGDFGAIGNASANSALAGTDSSPVILFVNGDLSIGGNAVVNGLVYVRGNWDNKQGTASINGAVVVNGTGNADGSAGNGSGNITGTQNLTISHECYVLQNVQKIGKFVQIAGTWRDF